MLLEKTKMDSKTDVPMTTTGYGIIRLRNRVQNFRILIRTASNSTMEKLDPPKNSYTSRITHKNVGCEDTLLNVPMPSVMCLQHGQLIDRCLS